MTDRHDEEYALNGITRDDFLRWKHSPVSKVLLRYLVDFAAQLRVAQLAELEHSDKPMEPKMQGEYKGRINTITELAGITFEDISRFYSDQEEDAHDDT